MAQSKLPQTPKQPSQVEYPGYLFLTPPRLIFNSNGLLGNVTSLADTDLVLDFKATGESLIYGIQSQRGRYLGILRNKVGENKPVTADDINKKVLEVLIGFDGTPRKNGEPEIKKAYMKYYRAQIAVEDLDVKITRNKFPPNNLLKYDILGRRIRRACKALIHRVNDNRVIHFCLDGINLYKTFNKTRETLRFYRSHTSSELRYVRKYWNVFKGHVLFYMGGQRVEAPDYITGVRIPEHDPRSPGKTRSSKKRSSVSGERHTSDGKRARLSVTESRDEGVVFFQSPLAEREVNTSSKPVNQGYTPRSLISLFDGL